MLRSTLTQAAQQGLVNAYEASHSKVVSKICGLFCVSLAYPSSLSAKQVYASAFTPAHLPVSVGPHVGGSPGRIRHSSDDDPLLDQEQQSLQLGGYRFERNFALLFGIQYGVSPLLLTSPGIVWEPTTTQL